MRILAFLVAGFVALLGLYGTDPLGSLTASAALGPGQTIEAPHAPASSWGRKLNPSGEVFERGFKAFYFDRNNQASSTFEEYAENIAIKYAWDDLHGINSQAFAAYWVGRLHFDVPATRQIAVSQGWSKARIFIDGVPVYEGSRQGEFTHHFSAGDHLIEVEYINNWHTVEFKVTLGEVITRRSSGEIASLLDSGHLASADVFYVGLYESGRADTSVDVRLPNTGKPAIVWLDSYEAIDWNVIAPEGLAAAVIAAYSPGSRLVGEKPEMVFHAQRGFGVHSDKVRGCSCAGGHFHCEDNNDLGNVADELRRLTGRSLAGAAARYSASSITVTRWRASSMEETERGRMEREQARERCQSQADPDFDTMLD